MFGVSKSASRRMVVSTVGALGLSLGSMASAAVYMGNGAGGFGGTVGSGSLSVTDTGGNVNFTFNPSGTFTGNDLVIYIDSTTGGVPDTSTITDPSNGTDGGNVAASGENVNNPSRSVVYFPSGFGADFALGFENNTYTALYQISANGSLNYITGATPSNSVYSLTLTEAQLGLSPGTGFSFVGSLIATSAYRSNETIGASTTVVDPGNPGGAPNAGYNGTTTFATASVFGTPAAVPEPASLGLLGLLSMIGLRRKSR